MRIKASFALAAGLGVILAAIPSWPIIRLRHSLIGTSRRLSRGR